MPRVIWRLVQIPLEHTLARVKSSIPVTESTAQVRVVTYGAALLGHWVISRKKSVGIISYI